MSLSYTVVDNPLTLDDLVIHLNRASECSLDTEADSMHHYRMRLCLIQISCGDRHWIVDPFRGLDLQPLWQTRAMQSLILHGADYDLRMLYQFYKFRPRRIFDTMIAAKCLGEERVGLSYLVQKFFGISLAKNNQKADWTVRPLPESMKQYAVADTLYLRALRDLLLERIRQLNRTSWIEEICQQIIENACAETTVPGQPNDEPWRIKGSQKLQPRQLAFLRQIWLWREAEAQAMDRPPYKVLTNESLLYLSRAIPDSAPHFHADQLPRLPRNFTGARLESFLQALRTADALPPESWPLPQRRPSRIPPSPDSNLLESLKNSRDRIASSLGIDPTLLANRQQLVALAMPGTWPEKRRKSALLDWQWKLLAPEIPA